MFRRSMPFFRLFLLMLAACSVYSQVQSNFQPSNERDSGSNPLWVTATAGKEQVRFASLGIVGRMRLEVLNQVGDRVYDSDYRDGSLLDWRLEGEEGRRLPDGLYGCFITVEELSGQTSRRRGILWLRDGEVRIETTPGSGARTAAVTDESDPVTLLPPDVALPITLLAHDGKEGRIISGRGGLSFRIGDIFSGNDVEHMRLTSDGKLGIGVEEPAAKLDVAGFIRTSEGIMFPDGTIQRSAAGVGLVSTTRDGTRRDSSTSGNGIGSSASGSPSGYAMSGGNRLLINGSTLFPRFALDGTGTTGNIVKWVSSTTIGDSAITESVGNIGIGTTTPGAKLEILGSQSGTLPTSATTQRVFSAWNPSTSYSGVASAQWFDLRTLGVNDFTNTSGQNVVFGQYTGYGTGTISRLNGLRIYLDAYNNNVTSAYGVYLDPVSMTGSGSIGSRYGVYQAGANDKNYFAGNVGIGTTSSTSKLTVEGNVNVTGTGNGIIFSDGSALTSNSTARIRAITYLAGCDTCSALADNDDQRTIFVNLIGPMTINSVTCFSDGGSPIVNLQRDDGTAANILTSDLTCSTTGTTSTGIVTAENTMSLNDQIHFVMVTAGGVARRATVIVKATVN